MWGLRTEATEPLGDGGDGRRPALLGNTAKSQATYGKPVKRMVGDVACAIPLGANIVGPCQTPAALESASISRSRRRSWTFWIAWAI